MGICNLLISVVQKRSVGPGMLVSQSPSGRRMHGSHPNPDHSKLSDLELLTVGALTHLVFHPPSIK